ncbi:MAG: PilZ domain-containing protein [Magnetococcales bacterium]|nr:PilZ domain-containing protein [Magnetococcales bacterium]
MLARLFGGKKKPRSNNERILSRFPLDVRVSLVLENGAVVHGTLKNMSTRGLFMSTMDRPFGLETGEEGDVGLEVDNPVDGSQMRFPCEVVRVDREGVALRFLVQADNRGGSFYPD